MSRAGEPLRLAPEISLRPLAAGATIMLPAPGAPLPGWPPLQREKLAMSVRGSVRHLLGQLKEGDQDAAQPLCERYFQRLVALERSLLEGAPRQAADEEDVALSAFDSFCRAAEQGRSPQ